MVFRPSLQGPKFLLPLLDHLPRALIELTQRLVLRLPVRPRRALLLDTLVQRVPEPVREHEAGNEVRLVSRVRQVVGPVRRVRAETDVEVVGAEEGDFELDVAQGFLQCALATVDEGYSCYSHRG